MQTTLDKLNIHSQGTISAISDPELQDRLISMGCVPGEKVELDRIAPLGDPMAIIVGNTHLSIRTYDASKVLVEEFSK